ncbi:MAG TPA: isocitrate lyase/phosphoenolpyruvate mutase family protein [Mucilaginibacter sp.]|jgi:2-methylisocitrate lyase-like PEP mutase family enzyme|nr:isocitrate lyase/phosphoenolpyruvate mutase family protein [Mucilaginibacter sp.]
MKHITTQRKTWQELLEGSDKPVLLPVAHDALTARLIELAGFDAYQIGGYALSGATHAIPDVDLEKFGEKKLTVESIITASPLPFMIDIDDGYGDVKNVTRTISEYIHLGASATFMEDQQPPKKCGHMDDKKVIPIHGMEEKIRAAVEARGDNKLFILARTDAIGPEGLNKAMKRAEQYLKAGADGVYLEGPTSINQLEQIGREFKNVPLATSVLENGGKTPWLSPNDFANMGFDMVLYPTTVIFQVAYATQQALKHLKKGERLPENRAVNMDDFMNIVDLPYWAGIEKKFEGRNV